MVIRLLAPMLLVALLAPAQVSRPRAGVGLPGHGDGANCDPGESAGGVDGNGNAQDCAPRAAGSGLSCAAPTELTIAAGAITIASTACYLVDTQADASTDDLSAITCSTGTHFILRAAADARTVVIKNGANLAITADFSMDNAKDTFFGLCMATDSVVAVSRHNNGT